MKVTFEIIPKFKITFSAEPSEGGKITAKIKDGDTPVQSGDTLPAGTVVLFTAEPKTEGNGYYILRWSGEDLKVSSDKKTAELTVKKDTEVKVQFLEYFVQNVNWDAAGSLKDKSGNWKKFHLIIHDSNTLTVFESSSGIVASKIARVEYDSGTKTLSVTQNGRGSIKFRSLPPQSSLPADWEIELKNVKVGTLELSDQQATTINVTVNKDNFIH